jgi:hypothetical protein
MQNQLSWLSPHIRYLLNGSSTIALFVVLARLSLPMEGRSAYLVKLWLLWSDVVIVTNLLPCYVFSFSLNGMI